jgi:hypothetical protein
MTTFVGPLFIALAAIFAILSLRRASTPAAKAYTRIAIIFAAVGLFLLWRTQTQL